MNDTTSPVPGPSGAPREAATSRIRLVPWSQLGQKRQGRLLLGMVTLVVSFGYTVTAFELPLGAASRPGAGMFPRAVGLLAVLISLWLVVESAVGRSEPEAVDLPDGERRRLVLIFLVGTISLMVLLPVLGQYLAGAIYSAVMAATLGTWPWWKGVLVGVAVSCGIAWAFINLLQVPLPAGNIFHA